MPLYAIRRKVGDVTPDEIDAAAFRAIFCATEYDSFHWVRSYWDREAGLLNCIYEAESVAQIREHSMRSNIPCDDVHEVTEILPGTYIRNSASPMTASVVAASAQPPGPAANMPQLVVD